MTKNAKEKLEAIRRLLFGTVKGEEGDVVSSAPAAAKAMAGEAGTGQHTDIPFQDDGQGEADHIGAAAGGGDADLPTG